MTRKALAALAVLVVLSTGAVPAEPFRRLTSLQISARFTGMEFTDEVHSAFVFDKGGVLRTFSMGRARTGAWRVENGELCLDREIDGRQCFEAWMFGKRVELRREPAPAEEGILQRPQCRQLTNQR